MYHQAKKTIENKLKFGEVFQVMGRYYNEIKREYCLKIKRAITPKPEAASQGWWLEELNESDFVPNEISVDLAKKENVNLFE